MALYVTKVPVPFINKVPQRTAEQDAAEAERNKNWDPNARRWPPSRRRGRPVHRQRAVRHRGAGRRAAPALATACRPWRRRRPPSAASARPRGRPSQPQPAADLTLSRPVPTPAPTTPKQQRAKLALLGLDAKVSEREQAGRTVYRVRVGPFEARAQADAAIEKLQAAGVESTLVRVERQ